MNCQYKCDAVMGVLLENKRNIAIRTLKWYLLIKACTSENRIVNERYCIKIKLKIYFYIPYQYHFELK